MVKLFAEHCASIGIHYNSNITLAKNVFEEARRHSANVELFRGDLLEVKTMRNLVDDFVDHFGGIDVLINNAGACYGYKHFSELDGELWDKTFDLNAKAPFYITGSAFKYMQANGGGKIINISSASVRYGASTKGLHYTASKAALDSMMLGFSKAGAPHNILVNSIRCGVIETDLHARIEGYSEEQYKRRISQIPLQRIGKPIDIARMALFLASDGGDFITGEIFTVAGGD
jgi:3-oxoacyl-[acyl-carrier protein] reductase